MVATMEMSGKTAADLELLFEEVHALDYAIERTVSGAQTPEDVLLLARNGIGSADAARHEWENRLKGVRVREQSAGTPKQYAAAEKRISDSDKAAAAAERRLTPAIENAREELRRLEAELKSFGAEQEQARAAKQKMDTSRDLLRGRLLPKMLRDLQATVSRPIERKYGGELRKLHSSLSLSSSVGQTNDIKRQIAEIEARIKAETPTTYADVYIPADPE